jgi:hypothetical protein
MISRADYCWKCQHITIQLDEWNSWVCQECHKIVSLSNSNTKKECDTPEGNFFNYTYEEKKK